MRLAEVQVRDIVEVGWEDVIGWHDWYEQDDMRRLATAESAMHYSVGYVLSRSRRALLLTQSVGASGNVSHVLRLPASQIRTIRMLARG